jgi:alpha-ribazole phosphatase
MKIAHPVLLMRHPRPKVAAGLCYGQSDIPLEAGWEATLEAVLPTLSDVQQIISSPLSRCLQPARWLGRHLALPVATDPRLMELNFGDWEGRLWDDFDGLQSRAWAEDFVARAPPGGESFQALATRVLAAVREHATSRPCLFLSHGGPIRALLAQANGEPLSAAFRRSVPYAELIPLAPTEAGP